MQNSNLVRIALETSDPGAARALLQSMADLYAQKSEEERAAQRDLLRATGDGEGRSAVNLWLGLDGCRGRRWLVVALRDDFRWEAAVFEGVAAVRRAYPSFRLALVDIPIGLRDKGTLERLCDREARRRLGRPRGSSVFPAPCRPALYAAAYEDASRINEELTGRRLSKQSWAIVPKIREMDEFLTAHEAARSRVRESHPEVCFWALAGRPMRYSKKTEEGLRERLAVLEKVRPGVTGMVREVRERLKRVAGADDLVDALVLAVGASVGADGLATLPERPEVDAMGLPMEIVYPRLDVP